jgi:hypothetical protein
VAVAKISFLRVCPTCIAHLGGNQSITSARPFSALSRKSMSALCDAVWRSSCFLWLEKPCPLHLRMAAALLLTFRHTAECLPDYGLLFRRRAQLRHQPARLYSWYCLSYLNRDKRFVCTSPAHDWILTIRMRRSAATIISRLVPSSRMRFAPWVTYLFHGCAGKIASPAGHVFCQRST